MNTAPAHGGKARRTAFRLKPPTPLEKDLHEAVGRSLDLFLLPPASWACYPAGHIKLTGQQAARLFRMGLRVGIPDVLVWHGGQTFGLEVKRPGASLSRTRIVRTRNGSSRAIEGQRETFERLEAAGMRIAIVHSVDEALSALREFGIPVRSHA